ncbi:MAG: cell division protein FtsZ [Rhodospirillales bacterium]|nr:cell division protein FtsZ [Rhodospirillales bacterium]
MTIQLGLPENQCLKPRITVIGVGGAGGNAVNNMILSGLQGVDFVVANTDAQALEQSQAERRIQLGVSITQGLGAGSRPDIGKAAAEEAMEQIMEQLIGSHMVFITAGMGGGTGTGATSVVARAAREQGMLTVGVVTKPFHFEGQQRMRLAEEGMAELQQYVDTLIMIPNQNLFRVANDKTTFTEAFKMADDVLHAGVRGVTDLMVQPGLINLDFADVRTVMSEMGKAMMGTGEADGECRAVESAEAAIANPLLDEVSMKGARGVLINITGGSDMTLFEVDQAANRIRDEVDSDANIIFGAAFDESMSGSMRVSLVATGIEAEGTAANPSGRPALTAIEGGQSVRQQVPAGTPVMARSAGQHALALDTHAQAQTEGAVVSEPVEDLAPEPVTVEQEPAPQAQPSRAFSFPGRGDAAEEATPPPAGSGRNDAFIAPAPVEVSKKSAEPVSQPSAFGSAALANNAPKEQRRPSLFKRITGAARGHRETARQEPAIESTIPKPVEAKAVLPEPVETRPVEVQAPAPASAPIVEKAEVRPEPTFLAPPQDSVTEASNVEDDVLDIPSFLRRRQN